MDNTEMTDRMYGCAVGAAIGDAMGMPLEFGPARPLRDLVREPIAGRLPAGRFTDDTELALALAESLLVKRPLDPDDLVRRFLKWMRSSPTDVGVHYAKVLGWMNSGQTWQEVSERITREMPATAGNGSVTRCWPIAIAWQGNREQLVADSLMQSRVTHPNADCMAGSVFVNWMIAELAGGAAMADAFQSALGAAEFSSEFCDVLVRAPNVDRADLKNSRWVRHTLESAVWALMNTGTFEDAVIQVINIGGDTDTAGSVVGALAGAAYGLQAIPERWVAKLNGEWPVGSGKTWNSSNFIRLVDRLRGDAA